MQRDIKIIYVHAVLARVTNKITQANCLLQTEIIRSDSTEELIAEQAVAMGITHILNLSALPKYHY